jgi:hypothetical protein
MSAVGSNADLDVPIITGPLGKPSGVDRSVETAAFACSFEAAANPNQP